MANLGNLLVMAALAHSTAENIAVHTNTVRATPFVIPPPAQAIDDAERRWAEWIALTPAAELSVGSILLVPAYNVPTNFATMAQSPAFALFGVIAIDNNGIHVRLIRSVASPQLEAAVAAQVVIAFGPNDLVLALPPVPAAAAAGIGALQYYTAHGSLRQSMLRLLEAPAPVVQLPPVPVAVPGAHNANQLGAMGLQDFAQLAGAIGVGARRASATDQYTYDRLGGVAAALCSTQGEYITLMMHFQHGGVPGAPPTAACFSTVNAYRTVRDYFDAAASHRPGETVTATKTTLESFLVLDWRDIDVLLITSPNMSPVTKFNFGPFCEVLFMSLGQFYGEMLVHAGLMATRALTTILRTNSHVTVAAAARILCQRVGTLATAPRPPMDAPPDVRRAWITACMAIDERDRDVREAADNHRDEEIDALRRNAGGVNGGGRGNGNNGNNTQGRGRGHDAGQDGGRGTKRPAEAQAKGKVTTRAELNKWFQSMINPFPGVQTSELPCFAWLCGKQPCAGKDGVLCKTNPANKHELSVVQQAKAGELRAWVRTHPSDIYRA